jgi:virulence-associated protein VapD
VVDAVNHYKKRIQEIDRIIPKLKNHGFRENTGIAYVTFASKETQQKAMKDFNFLKANNRFINKQLKIQNWKIEKCSSPSDIIWRNLNKNYKTRYIRRALIYLAILVVSVV